MHAQRHAHIGELPITGAVLSPQLLHGADCALRVQTQSTWGPQPPNQPPTPMQHRAPCTTLTGIAWVLISEGRCLILKPYNPQN